MNVGQQRHEAPGCDTTVRVRKYPYDARSSTKAPAPRRTRSPLDQGRPRRVPGATTPPPARKQLLHSQAGGCGQTHAPPQNLGRLPAEHQSECQTRPQTMVCVATPAVTAPLMWTLGATGGRRTRPCDSHMQAGGGGGTDIDTDPGTGTEEGQGVALRNTSKVETEDATRRESRVRNGGGC